MFYCKSGDRRFRQLVGLSTLVFQNSGLAFILGFLVLWDSRNTRKKGAQIEV